MSIFLEDYCLWTSYLLNFLDWSAQTCSVATYLCIISTVLLCSRTSKKCKTRVAPLPPLCTAPPCKISSSSSPDSPDDPYPENQVGRELVASLKPSHLNQPGHYHRQMFVSDVVGISFDEFGEHLDGAQHWRIRTRLDEGRQRRHDRVERTNAHCGGGAFCHLHDLHRTHLSNCLSTVETNKPRVSRHSGRSEPSE
jgi:hypothetical protein